MHAHVDFKHGITWTPQKIKLLIAASSTVLEEIQSYKIVSTHFSVPFPVYENFVEYINFVSTKIPCNPMHVSCMPMSTLSMGLRGPCMKNKIYLTPKSAEINF